MTTIRLLPFLFVLLTFTFGCSSGGEQQASADNPFVGHWQVEGFDITAAFNSKGRVRMNLPGGTTCAGTYTLSEADRVQIDYAPGQASCMSSTTTYAFPSDDVLTFDGMTTYRRLDALDDFSF